MFRCQIGYQKQIDIKIGHVKSGTQAQDVELDGTGHVVATDLLYISLTNTG